jgi:hypothetical protein
MLPGNPATGRRGVGATGDRQDSAGIRTLPHGRPYWDVTGAAAESR